MLLVLYWAFLSMIFSIVGCILNLEPIFIFLSHWSLKFMLCYSLVNSIFLMSGERGGCMVFYPSTDLIFCGKDFEDESAGYGVQITHEAGLTLCGLLCCNCVHLFLFLK